MKEALRPPSGSPILAASCLRNWGPGGVLKYILRRGWTILRYDAASAGTRPGEVFVKHSHRRARRTTKTRTILPSPAKNAGPAQTPSSVRKGDANTPAQSSTSRAKAQSSTNSPSSSAKIALTAFMPAPTSSQALPEKYRGQQRRNNLPTAAAATRHRWASLFPVPRRPKVCRMRRLKLRQSA